MLCISALKALLFWPLITVKSWILIWTIFKYLYSLFVLSFYWIRIWSIYSFTRIIVFNLLEINSTLSYIPVDKAICFLLPINCLLITIIITSTVVSHFIISLEKIIIKYINALFNYLNGFHNNILIIIKVLIYTI